MANSKHIYLFLLITSTVFVDQATKHQVVTHFLLGDTVSVIPGLFNLTHIHNTGVAFGMFARGSGLIRSLLLVLPVLIIMSLVVFYLRLSKTEFLQRVAVVLILGGAVSNLVDRFRLGYVVDFLDFHWRGVHFPSFNAADTFICIGVAMLFLASRALNKEKLVVANPGLEQVDRGKGQT
jgi:signal peptidase II